MRNGRSRCSISRSAGPARSQIAWASCADASSTPVSASRASFPSWPTRPKRRSCSDAPTHAEAVLGWLEERGRALNRASALATAARGRALLAGARGQPELAVAACERALAEHERSPVPFETARTLLILGDLQRRVKQRSAARETLGRALVSFEALGAELWAARARAELARIGGRRSSAGALTPAERRVADLVAEGRSNKEIAATLFVTPKTVETQLSRMYRKLGVHSRTALTRQLSNL